MCAGATNVEERRQPSASELTECTRQFARLSAREHDTPTLVDAFARLVCLIADAADEQLRAEELAAALLEW